MPGLVQMHTEAQVGFGYGAKRRWEASEILNGFQCWRTDGFLHQLTNNGNLLYVDNSNAMWRHSLAWYLGLEPAGGWQRYFALLQHLPRSLVRNACWRASYDWLEGALQLQDTLHQLAIQHGVLSVLVTSEWYSDYVRVLQQVAEQLYVLQWCYTTEIDLSSIDIEGLRKS